MNAPDDFVVALTVATKNGTAKWFRDDLTDSVLCVLPKEIVRLTIQRVPECPAEIESLWLIVRGVQLMCLPGSNSGELLRVLAASAVDDYETLARAKRSALDEAMNALNRSNSP
jgi:hypothetical protein